MTFAGLVRIDLAVGQVRHPGLVIYFKIYIVLSLSITDQMLIMFL